MTKRNLGAYFELENLSAGERLNFHHSGFGYRGKALFAVTGALFLFAVPIGGFVSKAKAQQVRVDSASANKSVKGWVNGTGGAYSASPAFTYADPIMAGAPDWVRGTDYYDHTVPAAHASDGGGGNQLDFSSIGNQAAIIQSGDDNLGFIVQMAPDWYHTNNQGALIQSGDENFAIFTQGDRFNEAIGVQYGDQNVGVIVQNEIPGNGYLTADQSASLFQFGDLNTSVTQQLGDSNAAATLEVGGGNTSVILQRSSDALDAPGPSLVANKRSRNNAIAVQDGDYNTSFISQNDAKSGVDGDGLDSGKLFGVGFVKYNGNDVSIDSPLSAAGVVSANDARIYGDGKNIAAAVQVGVGNTGSLIQRGDANAGVIIQVASR